MQSLAAFGKIVAGGRSQSNYQDPTLIKLQLTISGYQKQLQLILSPNCLLFLNTPDTVAIGDLYNPFQLPGHTLFIALHRWLLWQFFFLVICSSDLFTVQQGDSVRGREPPPLPFILPDLLHFLFGSPSFTYISVAASLRTLAFGLLYFGHTPFVQRSKRLRLNILETVLIIQWS